MHSWEEADVSILPGESGSQEAGAESVSLATSICVYVYLFPVKVGFV